MPKGTVKWFNESKGYGFISGEDGNDVFVNFVEIEGSGYRTLHEGERVEFEARTGERGLEASHVVKV